MQLLHAAVLLAVLVNAYGEVPVEVGEANVQVKEGEGAELSCTTNTDIIFCSFTDPTGESLIMQPGLNYDNGRIMFLGDDAKKDCGLKITNVQEKDNGEWKCTITAKTESGSAKKGDKAAQVTVIKPPTAVRIDIASPLVLTLPTEDSKQVRCLAEGGRPAPSFSWQLGNELYRGAVVDEEGGQAVTYTSNPEDNGKTLTCIVNHKGYSDEALKAGENKAALDLDIRFKPVESKKVQDFYGMKIGKPYDILMNFKSHPRPDELHWEMYDGTIVAQGSENKRYTAALLEDGPHAGFFSAKLTIDKVSVADQERGENKLVVKNDLGQTEYKFSMGIGEKPEEGGKVDGVKSVDDGSGPVIAIVIVALIIVIVIVVAVVARAQGILCFADKNVGDDVEKSAAQFEALEKGEPSPEKELIKEPLTEVKEAKPASPAALPAPPAVPEGEKEERRSNGAHTPV